VLAGILKDWQLFALFYAVVVELPLVGKVFHFSVLEMVVTEGARSRRALSASDEASLFHGFPHFLSDPHEST